MYYIYDLFVVDDKNKKVIKKIIEGLFSTQGTNALVQELWMPPNSFYFFEN